MKSICSVILILAAAMVARGADRSGGGPAVSVGYKL